MPICVASGDNVADVVVDVTYERPHDQSPHNNRCRINDSNGTSYPEIDNYFEKAFSHALELGLNYYPLQSIHASENHRRILYSLLPGERRGLKIAIQREYYYTERTLTRAHRDTTTLRTEYQFAMYLVHLAPILRLPVELLRQIFSLILDDQTPDIDTLIRTCHKWRDIVSSMLASLKLATWTSVNRVKDILEGGNRPLVVTIHPHNDTMDRPMDWIEAERYAALILAVSTSISRWRTLDILSLPDPQQTNSFFAEQSHTIVPLPMNHLRSLIIPIRHESSRFLDLLLPSIGSTASVLFTDIDLHSVQAMSYFAQPHCAQVFNYLTSFKCSLPRMDDVVDILPQFWQLEILDVSGLRFLAYDSDVELPLTQTLR